LVYVTPGGIGGHVVTERYRAKTLTLGAATLHGLPVTITNQTGGSFASRSVAGNIGLAVLSRYRITFDYVHHTLTLVPRVSLDAPFRVDRAGMGLNQTGPDAFVVLSTVAGGPAEQAGIHAGDRIVAFDGRNIAAEHLIPNDMHLLQTGSKPFTLTIQASGGQPATVTIHPRNLLAPPM
jgi:S1-C subfamily serine protease